MPPVSHFEFDNCRDCGMAVWRYAFYHPGRQYWTHVMAEEREVCPGFLRRRESNRRHRCALCSPDRYDSSPLLMKCDDCEDYFHNADHSDCMARHQREVHGHEWSTPNVVREVSLSHVSSG